MTNKDKINQLRDQGLSYGSIAKMVGLSRARVHQIYSGYNPQKNNKINAHIFVRDNWRCQWGSVCKGELVDIKGLVIHHIDFDDRNNNSNNLITLCKRCHAGFHSSNHIDEKIKSNLHKRTNRVCIVCRKEFWIKGSRKTCSKECLNKVKPILTTEEKRLRHNKRMRDYIRNRYATDKKFRETKSKENKNYQKKNKKKISDKLKEKYYANLEESRKKSRESARKYYKKIKEIKAEQVKVNTKKK